MAAAKLELVRILALAVAVGACADIAGLRDPDPVDATSPNGAGADGGADDALVDPAAVSIAPDALDLGAVGCGTASPSPKLITLKNDGDVPASYEVAVPEGTAFTVDGPLTGTVAPRSQQVLPVLVKPTMAGAQSAILSVRVGPVSKTIAAEATGIGPTLQMIPSEADFGDVRAQSGGSMDVELRNTGTDKLVIKSFSGAANGLSMTWGGGTGVLAIEPGKSATATVYVAPGDAGTAATATFVPVLEGAACGAVPSLPAKVGLVNRTVTFSVVDFDKQGCGTSPALGKDLVVTNYSPSDLSVTAAVAGNSVFQVTPASIVVAKASASDTPSTNKFTLKLKTPVTSTLGAITETVNLNVTGTPALAPPDGGPRTTTARVDVRGVVLALNPASLSFSVGCSYNSYYRRWYCGTSSKGFSVANTGNEPATLAWDYVRLTGNPSWRFSPPGSVGAGASASGSVTYDPGDRGSSTARLTPRVTSAWPACAPPPPLNFGGSTN